jgi:hypothetical protein
MNRTGTRLTVRTDRTWQPTLSHRFTDSPALLLASALQDHALGVSPHEL